MTNGHTAPMPPPDRRHNPKPYFQAGQRVICIDATPSRLAPELRPLIAGRIYVVRAIDVRSRWQWPRWGVLLEGVRLLYPGKDTLEWALHPRRFRPVVARPTDITMLDELLTTPAPARAVRQATGGNDDAR